jgi:hypothetical protein
MTTACGSIAEGKVRSICTPSRCLLPRKQCFGNHGARIGTLIACLMCAIPSLAELIVTVPGHERKNVSRFVAIGTNTIKIRAITIRDRMLVAAILKGSRTRQVYILLDNISPELRTLVGQNNLCVHISQKSRRGKFSSKKLSHSFILEIGKGYYQEWYGPLIWTKRAFGPVTQIFAGSGAGPGETFLSTSRTFDHDFSAASAVKLPGVKQR